MSSTPGSKSPLCTLNALDLKPEQELAIDRLYNYDATLLIAPMGFGKFVVSCTAALELIDDHQLRRVLYVAPLRVAESVAREEEQKWAQLNGRLALAVGNPKQRRAAMESDASIVVTNIDNVKWVVDNYGGEFDGIIIDEITKFKAAGGTRFRTMRHYTRKLRWRLGMSAQPVAESGGDIYAQALLLDLGKALGTRLDSFRQKYMYPTDYEQRNWELQEGAAVQISLALANLLYIAEGDDYEATLPPIEDTFIEIEASYETAVLYREMSGEGICEANGVEVVAANAGVITSKMQQIAGGGLYDNEGNVVWTDDVRRHAVLAYMAELTEPVLVTYEFSFQLDWLMEAFPDAPVMGAGRKITQRQMMAWDRGEVPVMICHPRSASHGLNLQYGCSHLVQMSPIWSADNHTQLIGRLRRRGQRSPVVRRTTFITKGTIDLTMKERQEFKQARAVDLLKVMTAPAKKLAN